MSARVAVPSVRRGPPLAWWGMAMFVATRDRALRDDDRLVLPSAVQEPALAAAGDPGAEARRPTRPARRPARVGGADVPGGARGTSRAAERDAALGRGRARRAGRRTSRWRCTSTSADLSRFSPSDHAYGSIYFLLLGADHAHVALGLLFDVWLLAKLVRGLTTLSPERAVGDRVLLARSERDHDRRDPDDPLAEAMTLRRLAFLQWFGILARRGRLVRLVPRRNRPPRRPYAIPRAAAGGSRSTRSSSASRSSRSF